MAILTEMNLPTYAAGRESDDGEITVNANGRDSLPAGGEALVRVQVQLLQRAW
jgi:hypothetical protein